MAKRQKATSDRTLNIRASRVAALDKLSISGPNQKHGHRYEPTPHGVLDDMMLGLEFEPSEYTFVDLGSGKGRIVCLATRYPFKKVIGVEFAEELHIAAKDNLQTFDAPWRRARDVELIHRDVTEWNLPVGPLVVFMYNPFGGPVMLDVVQKMKSAPHPSFVLYYEPLFSAVWDKAPFMRLLSEAQMWRVYATRPGPE